MDSVTVKQWVDSVESSFTFQHGKIELADNIGAIDVPEGFKYLNPEQSEVVLQDIWGNPDGSGTLGMLFPQGAGVFDGWAFIITYDEMGYVKDDDADKIDYEELLEEMKTDMEAANNEREKIGYEKIALIGWASKPFYDKDHNTLHWAKEIRFGESEENTLNYNVRILGRKGVLILNAVSEMNELTQVQPSIEKVQASFHFADGNKYADFDPGIDEVAGWTIGGLVAGKVLAKAGFFAFALKYLKFIGIALLAIAGAVWRVIRGQKRAAETMNRNITPPASG
jgi:uncharacterized membrane-anchored protein